LNIVENSAPLTQHLIIVKEDLRDVDVNCITARREEGYKKGREI
jgi:hypothetical protein